MLSCFHCFHCLNQNKSTQASRAFRPPSRAPHPGFRRSVTIPNFQQVFITASASFQEHSLPVQMPMHHIYVVTDLSITIHLHKHRQLALVWARRSLVLSREGLAYLGLSCVGASLSAIIPQEQGCSSNSESQPGRVGEPMLSECSPKLCRCINVLDNLLSKYLSLL
ncbi:hypothetical protein BDZ97DRAFT_1828791 [Flammula alnicola]|nr:hypothetical protein BDZ97DRAFT_1828791 [Flammula alnicola]